MALNELEERIIDSFTEALIDDIRVKEDAARKSAHVFFYFYKERLENKNLSLHKRLPEIWRGMKALGIEPYIEGCSILKGLTRWQEKIYEEFDSLAIGVGVGVEKKLFNTLEGGTKYSLSAKGIDFIDRQGYERID